MGKSLDELTLTDDKEKLKTVPDDISSDVDSDEPRRGMTRQAQLETPEYLGEEGEPGSGSRSGGNLARKVGTRDELKRSNERPGGATRVRKSDEKDTD